MRVFGARDIIRDTFSSFVFHLTPMLEVHERTADE